MTRSFRLPLVFILLILLVLLSACGSPAFTSSNPGVSGTPSHAQSQSSLSTQTAIGKFQEFALPQANSGLMRPAIDTQGRLWFGEMNRNYLASFDPHTGKFWQQTPPHGQYGIMGIVAAPDDTIWFAEQEANYIGHYFPQTGQYQTYQLPTITRPNPSDSSKMLHLPSAPNDLALDTHGTLWFTQLNANAIGSLNTANGSIHQYPLTSDPKAHALNPYGITVDAQGIVWFTSSTNNRLGRLNPTNGQISYFTPSGVSAPLMELVSDPHGAIWATTFNGGQLLRFDPTRSTFTIYDAPAPNGNPGALYGLTVASNGDIWVTVGSANLVARLDTRQQRFIYYAVPTPNSLPFGLVEGPDHTIWFTESGGNKIGMLQP
jgi:virginiamycin B lyase